MKDITEEESNVHVVTKCSNISSCIEPQQRQHYASGSFFKCVFWIRDGLIWLQIRIRGSTGLRIQIRLRIRILLFSSVALSLKIPTKIYFVF
jgi:hypothetical protein